LLPSAAQALMRGPQIEAFAGSTRSAPFNTRLTALAAKELALLNINVTKLVESARHFAWPGGV